jgi:hypothetical protein
LKVRYFDGFRNRFREKGMWLFRWEGVYVYVDREKRRNKAKVINVNNFEPDERCVGIHFTFDISVALKLKKKKKKPRRKLLKELYWALPSVILKWEE